MKLVQIVFSPTGGTQKIADTISEEWKGTVIHIDLSDAQMDHSKVIIGEEDIALVAVPSYGGRIPGLAAERLGKIRSHHAKCIIVCVYGNRAYEDTLVELKDIAGNCGFDIVAAIAAVAEHSILHQYATGRPDKKDTEELHDFAKTIYGKLLADETFASVLEVPGNQPYKKAGGAGLIPKATKDCVGCGLCVEKCPAQAISRDNLKTADHEKCISCMRCVVKCPKSARKISGVMVAVAALALKKVCGERKDNELFI